MLKIENLTKTFGDKKAVDNLTLHIRSGEIYGFIGHNGAGKTTTLKCASGILKPDSGEIEICGINLRENPVAAKKQMAIIPDNPDIYDYMSGIKYLNFIADIYGVEKSKREDAIRKWSRLFDIEKDLAEPVSSYSHGMKQKIVIISALIHEPRLMMLDEPFVGLDPLATHQVKEIMHEHCNNGGAIFFSTHVLDVAEKLCDKVAIIKNGRLIAEGTMDEVKGNSSLEDVFLDKYKEGDANA